MHTAEVESWLPQPGDWLGRGKGNVFVDYKIERFEGATFRAAARLGKKAANTERLAGRVASVIVRDESGSGRMIGPFARVVRRAVDVISNAAMAGEDEEMVRDIMDPMVAAAGAAYFGGRGGRKHSSTLTAAERVRRARKAARARWSKK